MSSKAVVTRPQVPPLSQSVLEQELTRVRGRIWMLDVASVLLTTVMAVLAYGLLLVVLDYHLRLGESLRQIAWAGFLLGLVAYLLWKLIPPLTRPVNPYFAARALEQSLPDTDNSLVNWLDLKEKPLPPTILDAVRKQALRELNSVHVEEAISNRNAIRLLLVAVVLLLALFGLRFLWPEQFTSLLQRVYFPFSPKPVPTHTRLQLKLPIEDEVVESPETASVLPIRVERRRPVTVAVAVEGKVPESVWIEYTSSLIPSPVSRSLAPPDKNQGRPYWSIVLQEHDIPNDGLLFRVRGGDGVTRPYQLVPEKGRPELEDIEVRLDFPEYLRRPPQRQNYGRIRAPEGTAVRLTVTADQAVKHGLLEVRIKDSTVMTLDLGPDRDTPSDDPRQARRLQLSVPWVLTRQLRPADSTTVVSYRVQMVSSDGKSGWSSDFPLEVVEDAAPWVVLKQIGAEPLQAEQNLVRLPLNDVAPIRGMTGDDHAVREVSLHLRSLDAAGRPGKELYPFGGKATDRGQQRNGLQQPRAFAQPAEEFRLILDLGKVTAQFQGEESQPHPFQVGDRLELWVEASDYKQPEPNVGKSKAIIIELTEPLDKKEQQEKREQAAQQQQQFEQQRHEEQQRREQQNPLPEDRPEQQDQQQHGKEQGEPRKEPGQPREQQGQENQPRPEQPQQGQDKPDQPQQNQPKDQKQQDQPKDAEPTKGAADQPREQKQPDKGQPQQRPDATQDPKNQTPSEQQNRPDPSQKDQPQGGQPKPMPGEQKPMPRPDQPDRQEPGKEQGEPRKEPGQPREQPGQENQPRPEQPQPGQDKPDQPQPGQPQQNQPKDQPKNQKQQDQPKDAAPKEGAADQPREQKPPDKGQPQQRPDAGQELKNETPPEQQNRPDPSQKDQPQGGQPKPMPGEQKPMPRPDQPDPKESGKEQGEPRKEPGQPREQQGQENQPRPEQRQQGQENLDQPQPGQPQQNQPKDQPKDQKQQDQPKDAAPKEGAADQPREQKPPDKGQPQQRPDAGQELKNETPPEQQNRPDPSQKDQPQGGQPKPMPGEQKPMPRPDQPDPKEPGKEQGEPRKEPVQPREQQGQENQPRPEQPQQGQERREQPQDGPAADDKPEAKEPKGNQPKDRADAEDKQLTPEQRREAEDIAKQAEELAEALRRFGKPDASPDPRQRGDNLPPDAPADPTDPEHLSKATDLLLDSLQEKMKRGEIDKEVLKRMQWTEEDARRFLERYQRLREQGLLDAVKGARTGKTTGIGRSATQIRSGRDLYLDPTLQPPPELRNAWENLTRKRAAPPK